MKTLRTDNLEKNNKEETPGKVYILDDLNKIKSK